MLPFSGFSISWANDSITHAEETGALTSNNENQQAGRNRRSVKNYLINRRFQLRWISSILVLALLIFITLGSYIYLSGTHQTELAEQLREECYAQLGYDAEALKAVINDPNQAHDQTVAWALAIVGGVMVLILAGMAIMQTHRVAGPIYALCRFMETVTKGNYRVPRALRKGDHFQEAGIALRDLVQSIREKEKTEIESLVALESIDGMPEGARAQVSELLAKKRSALE
jgi:hypothetical protein